ncbi:MAG TPA: PQQ-dependent sugar dehydrogenase [Thermoanaerobaculia bacterium]
MVARRVATGLQSPLAIAHAGDSRLFVTLQRGQVVIYEHGAMRPTPFLDIRPLVYCGSGGSCGERGLLSVAFHPRYRENGLFYVFYTDLNGDLVVARHSVSADPNIANSSGTVLLTIPHRTYGNHNGGQLVFGPDGYLYIGTGDGGGSGDPLENGQNLGSLLGKMLRIDVDSGSPYSVPASNPFAGATNARGEIWAWGLRNPWRFSFDRGNGDLWIADVGQGSWEEVNRQPAGSRGAENYGWSRMEGTHCFDPATACNDGSLILPVIEYGHTNGACSVTGGYRYRGARFPRMNGTYIYADFCNGLISGATDDGSGRWVTRPLRDTSALISAFGEDSAGELYLTDLNGSLFRVVDDIASNFNGDTSTDIVLRNYATGQNAIWLMNGTSIGAIVDLPQLTDLNWRIEGTADFDGDLHADILLRNYATGQNAIWLLTDSTLRAIVDLPRLPNVDYHIEGTGDFNDDGNPDIILRNYATGQNALWLMSRTSIQSIVDLPGLSSGIWRIESADDFSGDGRDDIVLRNYATGQNAVWVMNGTTFAGVSDLPALPDVNFRIDGVADFNGDLHADVVLRHSTSGRNAVWLMNRTSLSAIVDLPTLSNTAYEINGPR